MLFIIQKNYKLNNKFKTDKPILPQSIKSQYFI